LRQARGPALSPRLLYNEGGVAWTLHTSSRRTAPSHKEIASEPPPALSPRRWPVWSRRWRTRRRGRSTTAPRSRWRRGWRRRSRGARH